MSALTTSSGAATHPNPILHATHPPNPIATNPFIAPNMCILRTLKGQPHIQNIHTYIQTTRIADGWSTSGAQGVFCSLSRDDTHASRYHGVRMYSINADNFHSPSVLRRDLSHPILLLMSHRQVNSTERLNPKNLSKVLPNA